MPGSCGSCGIELSRNSLSREESGKDLGRLDVGGVGRGLQGVSEEEEEREPGVTIWPRGPGVWRLPLRPESSSRRETRVISSCPVFHVSLQAILWLMPGDPSERQGTR